MQTLLCLGAKNVGEIDPPPLAGWKKVICEENKHKKHYMEKCKGVIFLVKRTNLFPGQEPAPS